MTLDSYCKEKLIKQIDFLKIDVEGNEFAVIEWGRDSFKSEAVRVVQFEYGGTYIDSRILLKDFYDFFARMNYSFFPAPRCFKWVKLDLLTAKMIVGYAL